MYILCETLALVYFMHVCIMHVLITRLVFKMYIKLAIYQVKCCVMLALTSCLVSHIVAYSEM